nr:Chain X, PROTEIN (GRIP1) [synthetic construct]1BSX_Y Chain Y, PROTEIN (GRIP1) [synthetic construct]
GHKILHRLLQDSS